MSIKYIAWLRSAQPFLFLGSSKLSSRCYLFIYLFIYLFEMSLEKGKKKDDELEFDSSVGSVNGVLVWFGSTFVTWRTLSRSVAIHSPPICARCHRASKIPGLALFFRFFFFFWKTNAFHSILAVIQTSIFPPA